MGGPTKSAEKGSDHSNGSEEPNEPKSRNCNTFNVTAGNATRVNNDFQVFGAVGERLLEFIRYHNTRYIAVNDSFGTGWNFTHKYISIKQIVLKPILLSDDSRHTPSSFDQHSHEYKSAWSPTSYAPTSAEHS